METYIYYHEFDKTMKSHDLIKIGLEKYLKEKVDCLTILEGQPHRKPYFKEYPHIFHNVSHSGNWWVCAYGLVENGLDLQKIENKKVDRIAKRFFHPRETQWLSTQDEKSFYRIWAYNESYVKYVGDGLIKGLDYFSVIGEQGDKIGVQGVCQEEISFPDSDYFLVLTTKEKQKIIFEHLC